MPVFCSYSREDSAFALCLARDLKARGAEVWLDQLDITPGERWDRAIEHALANCSCLLLLLSPNSINSDNVMDEVSYALETHKTLIPVLHRECTIPFRLRRLQYVDFRSDYDMAVSALLRTLGVTEQPKAIEPQGEVGDERALEGSRDSGGALPPEVSETSRTSERTLGVTEQPKVIEPQGEVGDERALEGSRDSGGALQPEVSETTRKSRSFRKGPLFRRMSLFLKLYGSIAVGVIVLALGIWYAFARHLLDPLPNVFAVRIPVSCNAKEKLAFSSALIKKIEALPGVKASGVINRLPDTARQTTPLRIEGQPCCCNAEFHSIDQTYLVASFTPVVRGRGFSERDNASSPMVAGSVNPWQERVFRIRVRSPSLERCRCPTHSTNGSRLILRNCPNAPSSAS